jgi:hypothetical protein
MHRSRAQRQVPQIHGEAPLGTWPAATSAEKPRLSRPSACRVMNGLLKVLRIDTPPYLPACQPNNPVGRHSSSLRQTRKPGG